MFQHYITTLHNVCWFWGYHFALPHGSVNTPVIDLSLSKNTDSIKKVYLLQLITGRWTTRWAERLKSKRKAVNRVGTSCWGLCGLHSASLQCISPPYKWDIRSENHCLLSNAGKKYPDEIVCRGLRWTDAFCLHLTVCNESAWNAVIFPPDKRTLLAV